MGRPIVSARMVSFANLNMGENEHRLFLHLEVRN